MISIIKSLKLAILGFSFVASAASAEDFRVPTLSGPVVDQAGVLDPQAAAVIENGLRKLAAGGGTQINVLTVPSLAGLAVEQASIKVTDAWKLGGAKTDNGVLFLIAPAEHKVRIEVGQGLEGSLTDAFSNRIVRDVVLPEFRTGDYSGGTLHGLVEIIHHTDPNVDVQSLFGEQSAPQQRMQRRGVPQGPSLFKIIFFFIILIVIFANRGGGGGRRRGISPWTAGALGYGLGGGFGGGGGGWGGGSGGGGGWGGGGGGFSGGGASGSW